jgi:mono/diheme cytochrome c family protein
MNVLKAACLLAVLLIGMGGLRPGAVYAQQGEPRKRQLFREGARLWPVYCAQCHNARPGSEFAPYQWDAIMMHMRGLSNMPAENAQAILEYLKGGRE